MQGRAPVEWRMLAQQHKLRGDINGAIGLLKEGQSRWPLDAFFSSMAANMFEARKEWREALPFLDAAVLIVEQNRNANIGMCEPLGGWHGLAARRCVVLCHVKAYNKALCDARHWYDADFPVDLFIWSARWEERTAAVSLSAYTGDLVGAWRYYAELEALDHRALTLRRQPSPQHECGAEIVFWSGDYAGCITETSRVLELDERLVRASAWPVCLVLRLASRTRLCDSLDDAVSDLAHLCDKYGDPLPFLRGPLSLVYEEMVRGCAVTLRAYRKQWFKAIAAHLHTEPGLLTLQYLCVSYERQERQEMICAEKNRLPRRPISTKPQEQERCLELPQFSLEALGEWGPNEDQHDWDCDD